MGHDSIDEPVLHFLRKGQEQKMEASMIKKIVDDVMPQMISDRRHLHKHPELSFEEYQTTEFLCRELEAAGIEDIRRPVKTGVVAVIHGAYPGKTVAIRADIDALPIQEKNELEFCSVNDGVMHACGHDGHAAMLLAAARIFEQHKDELHGSIVCIFQHAEEVPPGGAQELYEAGVMEGVDELYGLHLSSNFPTGTYGVRAGALTSATDRFDIRVIGKGGHSSMPEQSIDPIVTGAEIIVALQSILSRRVAAFEPAVLSVCQVNAGDAYNIIPGEMILTGSTRTFSEEMRGKMEVMIEEIISGITKSAGASYEFKFERGYSSVINDKELTENVEQQLKKLWGEESILHINPIMPGEDFSALQKNCPACFVEIGTADEEKHTTFPHHNPNYRMDEEGLRYGLSYLLATIFDRLRA